MTRRIWGTTDNSAGSSQFKDVLTGSLSGENKKEV